MTDAQGTYRVSYHTLGCKLNFAETSAIGTALERAGFLRAQPGETPDICVVNTCSVTAEADKKGRSLIRRLHRQYPKAAIVVSGCYAQLKSTEVAALPGVEIVLGSGQKGEMAAYIERWMADRLPVSDVTPAKDIRTFHPSCEKGDRTRYFLKVQDGCDYWCTYCTIPMARGRSRSGSLESILAQARGVAAQGGKEIVLTGVNVGDYGKGTEHGFFDLIRALDRVEGIERYRISSIEPNLLTPDMIRWIARCSERFMPHFHIPLQSGSDHVLGVMRRHYDTALFASRIALIKKLMPHAFIGIDIMAGTRGESPEEWEKSLEFVRGLDVQQLHVFPYSERPGTRALELEGAVCQEEKHRRVSLLLEESQRKHSTFLCSHIGQIRPVLWEQPAAGSEVMHGFTDNYIRVETPFDPLLTGSVTRTLLEAEGPEQTLVGKPC